MLKKGMLSVGAFSFGASGLIDGLLRTFLNPFCLCRVMRIRDLDGVASGGAFARGAELRFSVSEPRLRCGRNIRLSSFSTKI